ncbi:hypothetical protein Dsin_026502 [Dipteronia sinensis]|uniref:Uncharacterized protein n=1 Tax=Dipteronia sinensis TaxID=43782 RepID=A0AAD9ZYC9_9ROSI|nr:hypothetical protein Dsin_026502 [Dipteronia sinensis]
MLQDSSVGHLEPLEPPNEHCIYEVPLNFRIRNNVYTPLLFSIGPLHYGKVGLAVMEHQKVEYYKKFCSRLFDDDPCLEEFMSFLQQHETRIRNSYRYVSGICPFESDVFQKMILHYSIFILELLLENHEGAKDGLLNQTLLKDALIRRDLVLLENQVPYFVLEKLYKLFYGIIHPSLLILSCNFLCICMPKEVLSLPRKEQEKIQVAHFTDLARSALV